jgi:AcrR family transcriptional regulator
VNRVAATAVSSHGLAGAPAALAGSDRRSRLLAATVAVVAERGYGAATVAEIASEAGVSHQEFVRCFADKEACYLAAYDVLVVWIATEIRGAIAGRGSWPRGVKAVVEAALEIVVADPRLARFCGTEPLLAGAPALERHRATVRHLASALRVGREHCAWGGELPEELEQTLVSGAIWSIAEHAAPASGKRLDQLAPDLTYFLLTPYLDAAEARRLAGE